MESLKLEKGDLIIENGDLATIEGVDEVSQCIERVLTTNKDEWFLDVHHGLDYAVIFAKPFDEEQARLAIVEAVYQEPRVRSVENIEFRFDRRDRYLEIFVEVVLQNGETVQEVIPVE